MTQDEAEDNSRTLGKAIGVGILCALVSGWCCAVLTTFVWQEPSYGGLLSWVVGIAAGVIYRKGEANASLLIGLSSFAGGIIGCVVVLASLYFNWGHMDQIAQYASASLAEEGGRNSLMEILSSWYWNLIYMWSSAFASGDISGGFSFGFVTVLIGITLAVFPIAGIAVLLENHGY